MKFSNKLLSYTTVEKFIAEELTPRGYEVEIIPGSLVDNYICYPPREDWNNIMFIETYLNEWSSGLAVHQCKKMRKAELDLIEKLREQANS